MMNPNNQCNVMTICVRYDLGNVYILSILQQQQIKLDATILNRQLYWTNDVGDCSPVVVLWSLFLTLMHLSVMSSQGEFGMPTGFDIFPSNFGQVFLPGATHTSNTPELHFVCDTSYSHQYASSSEVLAECQQPIVRHVGQRSDNHSWSTYQPMHRWIVSRHIDRCLTDILVNMSTDTSRSTYRPSVDRYVGRLIGQHSADMSTDTLVECQSICRPIYRLRGAHNTHVPWQQLAQ